MGEENKNMRRKETWGGCSAKEFQVCATALKQSHCSIEKIKNSSEEYDKVLKLEYAKV